MTHTPHRWVLDEDGEPFIYQLNTAGTNIFSLHVQGGNVDTGERTSRKHRRNIAEFIYRACNAHDELVAALRGLVCELESVNVPAPGLIHAKRALAKVEGA